MKRAVLINPWIHDFAAFNLWSAPLGLYNILVSLSKFDIDIHLIDCVDSPVKQKVDGRSHIRKEKIDKPKAYRSIPRYYYRFGIERTNLEKKLKALLPIDVFLVTSHMSYWYPGVAETIEVLRSVSPGTPVVLGGIYATLYPEHAKNVCRADIVHEGPFSDDVLPGLKKVKNEVHWSELIDARSYAPILTGRGCPMRCSYCASHMLDPSFTQRPVDDVYNEILTLYSKGIRNFAFYDDALLVNSEEHVVPLLQRVISDMPMTNFFTPVGLQSRLITKNIAKLMRDANFGYIRIGYETGDPHRQKETGGKVYDSELEQGISYLTEAGFRPEDIGVFIMYGLPDQPIEEVKKAVDHVKGLGVRPVLTEFSPVKGTKEAQKLSGFDIEEPLFTNNTAFSLLFSRYGRNEIDSLKLAARSK